MDGHSLQQRWNNLKNRLHELRPEGDVRVLAASKRQPCSVIEEAYLCGLRSFGENYWNELHEKQMTLGRPDLEWHFIGRLQSNKINKLVGSCELIHSVCDLEHLRKLEEVCIRKNVEQKVLLQVNVAGEASKAGLRPQDGEMYLDLASRLKCVRLVGLMTMPPLFDDPSQTEPYFQELKKIAERWNLLISGQRHEFSELSMGTSSDFEYAVRAGATIVRIGSALLGSRVSGARGKNE